MSQQQGDTRQTPLAASGPLTASGPRKAATIYDIARAADVSHQSVSRYMRGLDMRESTKSRIEKALETLDYKPNLAARALITGRSNRIGVLTHEIDQYGPSLIVRGATAAAREAGYLLDVVSLDMGDVEEIGQALTALTQYGLEGIIAFASTDSTRAVFEQTAFDVPVVIAAEPDDPETVRNADTDEEGIEGLVAHLAGLGHDSFLHIAGPETWSAARNRLHAFRAAVERHGAVVAGVVHGDWSARSGHDAVRALPSEGIPTAIVAANDQMALGAMYALEARGLSVPGDVSVTGIDDTPESAYFRPALTTIRLDFTSQGSAAFRSLLDQIQGAGRGEPPAPPKTTLVLRDSTGPARRR